MISALLIFVIPITICAAMVAAYAHYENKFPFKWLAALAFFCLCAMSAMAQGVAYLSSGSTTVSIQGQKVLKPVFPGYVFVYTNAIGSSLAPIYTDVTLTTQKANPTPTDQYGNFNFWVLPSTVYYRICPTQATCISPIYSDTTGGFANGFNVENFPGGDIGAKINAADAALAGQVVTLLVNSPGVISTPATLSSGHALRFKAGVTENATISLSGNTRISCDGGVVVTTSIANPILSSGTNVSMSDCTFSGVGGDILKAVGATNVRMANMTGTSIGILEADGGSGIKVSHSTVTGATFGVVTLLTSDVSVDDLSCTGTGNCAQYQNHDANFNAGGPSSRATVTSLGAGHITFNNIRCFNVVACAWGSVGYDVIISNSQAIGCSDVCFDAEGSMDVKFIGNTASSCAVGCGSTFFFADNIQFIDSTFAGIILYKNSSGNPNLSGYSQIIGGFIDCGSTISNGIVAEPVTAVSVTGVRMRNCVIATTGQQGAWNVKNNLMEFTFANTGPFSAITIAGVVFGALVDVYGNQITSPLQPSGSAGITLQTAYPNATQTFLIRKNTTLGFPIDILTSNNGTNPSAGMITNLDDNWAGSNNIVHNHPGTNVDVYNELSRLSLSGSTWVRTVFTGTNITHMSGAVALASAATIAPTTKLNFITGTTQTTTITPPPGIIAGECMTFVSGSTWSVATGGNLIMKTSPTTFGPNESLQICYDNDSTHNFYVNHP